MKEPLRIGLLLAAVVLAYGNTLVNSFTLDDNLYITLNPQVTDVSARALLAVNKLTNLFRPVTFATLALNWKLGGARPFGYHLFNLMLHAAIALLLYLLLEMILIKSPPRISPEGESSPGILPALIPAPQAKAVAFAAALIFAMHPIHTEAVSSIVGRAELLAAGFLLAAWILHLRDRQIPALICFALALLSKESAVVFLPLVLIGDYARGKWKQHLRYVLIAGVTVAYLGLLWKMQGGRLGRPSISLLDNPLATLPAPWRILNALRVAWKYVALHFYPAKLSCDYSFNEIRVYRDWRHTLPAALAALAAVGAWMWAVRKRRSGLIVAGGIYLVGFAVTANILMPTGTIMAERLAYLPSAGFCLLLALGWSWLKDRQRLVALAALTAVVAAFGMRTMVRNRDWKDNMALFAAAVQAVPGSAKMHANLGGEYLAMGRLDLAGPELQAALQIDKEYPDALSSYGLLQYRIGNYQAAGGFMERALSMSGRTNPNYDFMAVNFAALLMQTNHNDGALDLLNREIAESPRYARAWANRAVLRYKQGETAPARSDAEAALRLDPENTQAQNLLRLLNTPAGTASQP
jgi:Flp pilus assembly protein TadD